MSKIKNFEVIDESLNEVFDKIQSIFSASEGYLNPNYVISNISVETGFRNEIVRDSIKKKILQCLFRFISTHSELSMLVN